MRLAGNLRGELLLGLGLRAAGAASSFVLTLMIARLFGAGAVGLYQIGLTTMVLTTLVASLGLDVVLVRTISGLLRHDRPGDAGATFAAGRRTVLRRGVVVAVAVGALAYPLATLALDEPKVAPFVLAFAPAVLMLALLKVNNGLLRVTGRVVLSQSLEGVFYTTLATGALALIWLGGLKVGPLVAPIAYVAAMAAALAISWRAADRRMSGWPAGEGSLAAKPGLLIVGAPLMVQAGDWLMLLAITTTEGVAQGGVYRVAVQVCMLFQLVNASFATMAGPHVARASAAGERPEILRIVRTAGLIGLALCVPLIVAGLAAPQWILGLFGPAFRAGSTALQLLVVAQTINVALGPVGTALIMVGRERTVLLVECVATITGVTIAVLSLGTFGIAGVAAGSLAASAIRNGSNALLLRRALAQDSAAS
jgi:O-antigen/teichoic acid export membrane protein